MKTEDQDAKILNEIIAPVYSNVIRVRDSLDVALSTIPNKICGCSKLTASKSTK